MSLLKSKTSRSLACTCIVISALTVAGCGANPAALDPSGGGSTFTSTGITEALVTGLVFAPTTASAVMVAPFSGTVSFSLNPAASAKSWVYAGPSISGPLKDGTLSKSTAALILGPFTWLCPSGSCADNPRYRGVGGPNGDFQNDHFIRWGGIKGPDPSRDYSSLQFSWPATRDLSGFSGIVFWARGSGNFAVNLVAPNPFNSSDPAPVYSGWNFYLQRFGGELNGTGEWKEIIVPFTSMVQEYGLASDKTAVLKKVMGLQFDQQSPYTENFQLDLDYIRFF